MGTLGTKRLSSATVLSSQVRVSKRPDADGYIVSGPAVSSSTSLSFSVTQAGSATSLTAINGPVITGLIYLDQNNLPSSSSAVSTLGGNVQINGTNFNSTDQIYLNNVPISKVYGNAQVMYATIPAGATGNLVIGVFSTANIGSQSNNRVRYSSAPSWITTAALSFYNGIAANIQLQSSSDSAVTYTVKSGSGTLPTGLSLLSSGYITGTPTGFSSTTVSSLIIIATDSEGQGTQQGFNITVLIGEDYFRQTTLLLSGESSTFISDASANNFQITRFGDTRPSRFSPYWPGGWSAYFDGTGDYLNIATSTAFGLGTGDFTIECWLYPTANPANGPGTFLDLRTGATATAAALRINNSFQLIFYNGPGNVETTFTTRTVTLGAWYHVAVVRISGTVFGYINGALAGSVAAAGDLGTTQPAMIGQNQTAGYNFYGYISNFRIIKSTAIYTANFTPSTTAMTTRANVSLLTLRDSTLTDISGSNFSITRNGDVAISTFSPFNSVPQTIVPVSYSAFLDGTGDWLSVTNTPANFGSNDFTVEFWAFFTTNSAGLQPLVSNAGTADGQGWMIIVDSDNTLSAYMSTLANSWTNTIRSSYTPLLRSWTHIALVRSTNQITLYADGVAIGLTYIFSGFILNAITGNFNIGYYAYFAGGARAFNGSISNVRLINNLALYNSNFVVPTAPLTAISGTTLLACHSASFVDGSVNNYTVTVNGDARPRVSNPFGDTVTAISNYSWSASSYGSSAYFDGTGDYLTLLGTGHNPGTGDFTWESWIYTTAAYGNNTYLLVVDTTTTGLYIGYDTAGTLVVGQRSVGANNSVSYTLPLTQWVHLAVSRSGTTLRIFANGQQILSGTNAINYSGTGTVYVLGGLAGAVVVPAGYYSNYRFVKGTALYTAAFIPPTAPLTTVANTSVLTLQNDIGTSTFQFVDQGPANTLITRNGDATQGSFTPYVPASWSAYFDGTGDYLQLSSQAMSLSSNNFTIEMWVYLNVLPTSDNWPASWSSTGVLIAVGSANLGDGFNCIIGSTQIFCQNNDSKIGSATHGMVANRWYHVAYVRNGNTISFFVNGNLCGTVSFSTAIGTGASTWIGSETGQGAYINGYISNLRVVNGTALYTANFTPATTTLTSVTNNSLLALTGPIMQDYGPNRFAITRNGDVKITTFGPHAPHTVTPLGYSVYFNGSSTYLTLPQTSALAFGTGDFTAEFWYYKLASGTQTILDYTVLGGFGIQVTDTQVVATISLGSTFGYNTVIALNTWTHIAFARSSGSVTLFVNGAVIGSQTVAYTFLCPSAPNIGRNAGGNSQFVSGYISNFRIINGNALYTASFVAPTQTLTAVANTSVLICHTTSFVDSSINNLAITVVSTTQPSQINPYGYTANVGVTYSPTVHGGSVYLDGTGDYLSLPDTPAHRLLGNNHTIECWFYETVVTAANTPTLWQINGDGTAWAASRLGINATTRVIDLLMTVNASSWTVNSSSTATYNRGGWNHLAQVRNGTTIRVFLNGSLIIDTTLSGTLYAGATNWIGNLSFSSGTWFVAGYITGFRIVNGTALYTNAFVLPTTATTTPVANTAFQCNFTNSAIYDSSYRTALTSVGDARAVTNTYKFGSGCLYFDGTGDYLSIPYSPLYALEACDFTVEAWVYRNAIGAEHNIAVTRSAAGADGWNLRINSNNTLQFYYTGGSSVTSTGTIPATTWTHVAVTRNGTAVKLFINGTVDGSATFSNGTANSQALRIGVDNSNATGYMNGYIDDLRITQGYARYTANFTAPIASLPTL